MESLLSNVVSKGACLPLHAGICTGALLFSFSVPTLSLKFRPFSRSNRLSANPILLFLCCRTVIFASTPVEFDAAEKKLLNQSSTTPIDYIVGDSSDATVFAGALGKLLVVCSGGGQTGLVVGKVVAMCAEVIELKSGKIFAPSILTKEGITSLLRISTSEKFSTPVSGVRDADNGLDSSDAVSDIFDIQQEVRSSAQLGSARLGSAR